MRFYFLIICLFTLFSCSTFNRAPSALEFTEKTCVNSLEELMQAYANKERIGELEKSLLFHYNTTYSLKYRMATDEGSKLVDVSTYVASREDDSGVDWWHYTEVVTSKDSDVKTNNTDQAQEYYKMVDEAIEVTIDHYRNRRNWGEKFFAKLKAGARKYAHRSSYINVRNEVDDDIGDIIGTLKIVESDSVAKTKLPMEEILDVSLPPNKNLKYELSNFAIQRDYNRPVFAELAAHLIHFTRKKVKEEGLDPDTPLFYTYADRPSFMMYKQLGFKQVEDQEQLNIDGVKWKIIALTPNDLYGIVERVGKTRSTFNEVESNHLLKLSKALDQIDDRPLEMQGFNGFVVENSARSTVEVKNVKLVVSEQIKSSKGGGVKELRVVGDEYSDLYEGAVIESKYLPLKEGDNFTNSYGWKVTYKKGVLHLLRDNIEMTIETSPDLRNFLSLKFNAEYRGRVWDFKTRF